MNLFKNLVKLQGSKNNLTKEIKTRTHFVGMTDGS